MTQSAQINRIFYAGLLVFLICAWFSKGFIHPDEHFQLLEFASYKLGNFPASELPWEFHQQIRPGLPVWIASSYLQVMNTIGIRDPFLQADFLRLIIASLNWFVFLYFFKKFTFYFNLTYQPLLFAILLVGLWFMPWISVRYSSENLAALSFLAALTILFESSLEISKTWYRLLLAGFVFALTFYLRYQMGFALIGLGAWLIFIGRINFKAALLVTLGFIVGLFIDVICDFWLYGNWIASPVNYFQANIIEGVAAEFGVSPWWGYFELFFFKAVPPVSIILLILFFSGLYKLRMHVLVWIVIPFLAAHFLTGHKEMRFLFPISVPFLFICTAGSEYFQNNYKNWKSLRLFLKIILALNLILLLIRSIIPSREIVNYYQFVHRWKEATPLMITFEEDFYYQSGLTVHFYQRQNFERVMLPDESHLADYLTLHQPGKIWVLERKPGTILSADYEIKTLYCALPEWILANNTNEWQSRSKLWKILELTRNKPTAQTAE